MNGQPPQMIDRYGRIQIDERKSRFICTVNRVTTEDEAREFVSGIRKELWDANHHCVAWIIGDGGRLQRSNDDGEPPGTAGTPMLEVLRRRELTDTIAIVTRYFGGTLLGAGGLIRAYGRAVGEAIDATGIVQRVTLERMLIRVGHGDAGRFEHAIRASPYPPDEVSYDDQGAIVSLSIAPCDVASLAAWVAEHSNGSAVLEPQGSIYVERRV